MPGLVRAEERTTNLDIIMGEKMHANFNQLCLMWDLFVALKGK